MRLRRARGGTRPAARRGGFRAWVGDAREWGARGQGRVGRVRAVGSTATSIAPVQESNVRGKRRRAGECAPRGVRKHAPRCVATGTLDVYAPLGLRGPSIARSALHEAPRASWTEGTRWGIRARKRCCRWRAARHSLLFLRAASPSRLEVFRRTRMSAVSATRDSRTANERGAHRYPRKARARRSFAARDALG